MKKKIKLNQIKVQSFVTELGDKSAKIKGGAKTLEGCSIIICSEIDACITARGACDLLP